MTFAVLCAAALCVVPASAQAACKLPPHLRGEQPSKVVKLSGSRTIRKGTGKLALKWRTNRGLDGPVIEWWNGCRTGLWSSSSDTSHSSRRGRFHRALFSKFTAPRGRVHLWALMSDWNSVDEDQTEVGTSAFYLGTVLVADTVPLTELGVFSGIDRPWVPIDQRPATPFKLTAAVSAAFTTQQRSTLTSSVAVKVCKTEVCSTFAIADSTRKIAARVLEQTPAFGDRPAYVIERSYWHRDEPGAAVDLSLDQIRALRAEIAGGATVRLVSRTALTADNRRVPTQRVRTDKMLKLSDLPDSWEAALL